MDIKSLNGSVLAQQVEKRPEVQPTDKIKTGESTDRDANGRRERSDEQERRELNPQELEAVIRNLKKLPGVKEKSLQVLAKEVNGKDIVFIQDLKGNVVRRMPANELVHLIVDKDKTTGNLLNKAS